MLSIAAKSIAGDWNRVSGAEGYRHTHSVFGGPESASFTLKRDTRRLHSDVGGFAPVYVSMGGAPVWSGRMAQTPTERSDQSVFQVQCEGWYRQLYGKPVDKTWVISDLSRFVDSRSMSGATLAANAFYAGGQVAVGDREIYLAIPNGTVCTNGGTVGITLDLGPNNYVAAMFLTYTAVGASFSQYTNVRIKAIANNSPNLHTGPWSSLMVSQLLSDTAGPYSPSGSSGGNYRYLHIYLENQSGFTASGDGWVKISNVGVFTDSADLSSSASVLKASTVIGESLGLGVTPNISTDTSGVAVTTFSIPHFPADRGRVAVGDLIQRANAYHAYQFFLSRDSTPRATYRAIPTTPTWILNDKDAYKISNGGANDASEVTGEVIVQYTGASGIPAEVTVTNSNTIIGKRGDVNTKILAPSTPMTSAAATQLGTIYLNTHVLQPFKATAVLTGSITNYTTGAQTPLALLPAGDAILLGSETDPDTGARGRIGIITQVDYEHDTQTAQVTIDSPRDFLDALLERMGVSVR